ncbi:hypothetical protein IC762_33100 [Bradyrhizobium genosp. L]|uniref:hypothetical protein n=1 Tax=Bradyrhizobium genosp. L TaxID=83637 RepID=UPI0018A25BD0|nr:hypothetical protein [Bradyrhizobium genosp. L]QPF84393.1 hypothetical protein IC762_33100 [Bradyrhizobium genosp. L]
MRLRALALSVALVTSGLVAADMASAAELAVPYRHHAYHHAHHARYAYQPGYVFWDSVYPPALYGAYPKPVEEVAALKAQASPARTHWSPGWALWPDRYY